MATPEFIFCYDGAQILYSRSDRLLGLRENSSSIKVLCHLEQYRFATFCVPARMSLEARRKFRCALDQLLYNVVKENDEWVVSVNKIQEQTLSFVPLDLLQLITQYLLQGRADLINFVCISRVGATDFDVLAYKDEFLVSPTEVDTGRCVFVFKKSMRDAWQLMLKEDPAAKQKENSQALRILMCLIYCEGGMHERNYCHSSHPLRMLAHFAASALLTSRHKCEKEREKLAAADEDKNDFDIACLNDQVDILNRLFFTFGTGYYPTGLHTKEWAPFLSAFRRERPPPRFNLQDWAPLLDKNQ